MAGELATQALVLRSRIVLAVLAAGHANQQIASALDDPQVTVGKWRRSFGRSDLSDICGRQRTGSKALS